VTAALPEAIVPEWPAPASVRALFTTRAGGVSQGPFASLNLGDHVGDAPARVAENRARLRSRLPAEPRWLRQAHGTRVARVDQPNFDGTADGAVSREPGVVCAVLVADCLPVLLCDAEATVVGVAHAGWRGLASGVVEETVAAMALDPTRLRAWLGPAIGPDSFEVGDDVRAAFLARDSRAAFAFAPRDNGKWLANLYLLARQRLAACGVRAVCGEPTCTFSDPRRFFSYRRDGETGRMAACIWLEGG
jgi:YfiH family protein